MVPNYSYGRSYFYEKSEKRYQMPISRSYTSLHIYRYRGKFPRENV